MKNTILFFFLLLAAAVSAQSNSFVTDRLRAAEYFRIGTNTSQKVTGFDRVITAPGTHDSLPTSRAVVDFLEANFTPIGYYTAGTGISISDDVITNAAPDQVVGLTGGGISVITGTYPNFTITSNEVDGSTTNELQNLSLSGQSLSISSGTGVTLPVVGVSAGTGIGVSGSSGTFTVTNTGDLSATNEIQTLSIDGSDLTLSLGGGTVTLPGGAWPLLAPDGNESSPSYSFANSPGSGMYHASGSKPTISVAGANGTKSDRGTALNFHSGDAVDGNGGGVGFLSGASSGNGNGGTFNFAAGSAVNGDGGQFVIDGGDSSFGQGGGTTITGGFGKTGGGGINILSGAAADVDGAPVRLIAGDSYSAGGGNIELNPGTGVGVNGNVIVSINYAKYGADFSGTIVTDPQGMTDVTSVNILKQTPVSYTNAAAPNNTIFYSTTDSKLSYKDPAGVVHNLY